MSIKRSLALFRADTPGVQAVAIVDLSTCTVLVSESAVPMGQEQFDELAGAARGLLGENGSGHAVSFAYRAGLASSQVFRRDKAEADDALIMVLSDTARDPAALAAAGTAFLTNALGGGAA